MVLVIYPAQAAKPEVSGMLKLILVFYNIQKIIDRYRLPADILPQHSTPLIIHHASGLADWIREVEKREMMKFKRYGSVIGWWQEAILYPST
jgi:hypothetical protein